MTAAAPTLESGRPHDAALFYVERMKWRPVPIRPGEKSPAIPAWQNVATDTGLVNDWWGRWPEYGVGIVCGAASGIFALDVDVAGSKAGDETLAELEARHGPLPATVEAITGSGGRHIVFRFPEGRRLSNSAGRLGPGLDIRGEGGQIVVYPSFHATGTRYEWEAEHRPGEVEIAEAPEWLLELLYEPETVTVERGDRGSYETATTAWDRFNLQPDATTITGRLLVEAGWTFRHQARGGKRELYFIRPGKGPEEEHGATVGKVAPGVLFVFTDGDPRFKDWHPYDAADVYAIVRHAGDKVAADRELHSLGWGARSWLSAEERQAWVDSVRHTAPPGRPQGSVVLPESFWAARHHLGYIRQAARARYVAPDAVLGAVLARVAALTPHTVEIPPLVGGSVGLTFFAALVGTPEAGKTSAAKVAAELFPVPTARAGRVRDLLPVGSGEGFIEALFGEVSEDDGTGKKVRVKRQIHDAAVFYIDEGATLAELGNRQGSTLLSTLRTAFTHGTLGQTNASVERRRELQGHAYVYGVTLGIQPEIAGPLLSDKSAGTPQRFVWLMAEDPGRGDERVPWPSPPLGWQGPSVALLEGVAAARGGWRRHPFIIDLDIELEVITDRLEVIKGGTDRDPADAHRMLVRLKVAGLLAVLDGRLDIGPEDWALAGVVVDTSREVRRRVEAVLDEADERRERAHGERLGTRESFAEEAREARALTSAARSAGRRVWKDAADGVHEGCALRCLSQAMASAHKKLIEVEQAVELAVTNGWIRESEGRWTPGPVEPK